MEFWYPHILSWPSSDNVKFGLYFSIKLHGLHAWHKSGNIQEILCFNFLGECWFFRWGENRSTGVKPPSAEKRTNNKLNPHMASSRLFIDVSDSSTCESLRLIQQNYRELCLNDGESGQLCGCITLLWKAWIAQITQKGKSNLTVFININHEIYGRMKARTADCRELQRHWRVVNDWSGSNTWT